MQKGKRVAKIGIKALLDCARQAARDGDVAEARANYQKILSLAPKHKTAKSEMKRLLRPKTTGAQDGTFQEIQKLSRLVGEGALKDGLLLAGRLLRTNPRLTAVHVLAGICHLNSGAPDRAVESFQAAVALDGQNVDALNNLGWALRETNDRGAATQAFRRALAINRDHLLSLTGLGLTLCEDFQFSEAWKAIGRAYDLAPLDAQVLRAVRFYYSEISQPQKAETLLAGAMIRAPQDTALKLELSALLVEMGKTAEARKLLRALVQSAPDLSHAHGLLAKITRYEAGDTHIETMRTQLKAAQSPEEEIELAFALGKATEDVGNIDESFALYRRANQRHRKRIHYDISLDAKLFQSLKARFDVKEGKGATAGKCVSDVPIFIVGMPRSGTTLVERLLSNHSDVTAGGELWALDDLIRPRVKKILAHNNAALSEIAASYLEALHRKSPTARYVTDKNPENFRWIGLIAEALPNAKIIALKRDARDNGFSIYKNYFGSEGIKYGYDLGEIGKCRRLHDDLMAHWQAVFPDRIHTCDYETLTREPKAEARNLFDFCGLDYSDDLLAIEKNPALVRTASIGQANRGIYRSSVDAWERFRDHLGPLFSELDL